MQRRAGFHFPLTVQTKSGHFTLKGKRPPPPATFPISPPRSVSLSRPDAASLTFSSGAADNSYPEC